LGVALAEDIAKQSFKINGIIDPVVIVEAESAMEKIKKILDQELPDLKVGSIVDQEELL